MAERPVVNGRVEGSSPSSSAVALAKAEGSSPPRRGGFSELYTLRNRGGLLSSDMRYKCATQGTMIGVTVAGINKITESWQSGIALAC